MARTKKILKTVEGNTAPPIVLTAQRSGTVINLTGCTVDLIITKGNVQTNVGHTSCTITSAATGIVSYVRQAGDIPTAGTYPSDLKVTYSDATFEVLYDIVQIKAEKKSNSTV